MWFRSLLTREPKMSEEKKVRVKVSNADFVVACRNSETHGEVAAKTGLSVSSVAARKTKLRKLGVNLQKQTRKAAVVDVAALNDLLK